MYPETLVCRPSSDLPQSEQLSNAVAYGAAQELVESLGMIRHCVEQLSAEQVWWRPHESLNSIGNLLLHLTGNLRQWVVVGLGGGVDARERPREFAERERLPPETLLSELERCVAEAQAVLGNLSAENLLASRIIQGFQMTGIGALWHTVAHFRGHTQEIISLTRQILGSHYRFAWVPQPAAQGAGTA